MNYQINLFDLSVDERLRLAEESNDVGLLSALAKDEDSDVRYSALNNPNVTADVLKEFVEDENWVIREAIASHPKVSPEILQILAEDEDSDVQVAVAKNSNSTPEILLSLIESEEYPINLSIAENPNSTVAIKKAGSLATEISKVKKVELIAGKNYFDDYLEPLFYTGLNKNRGENGFYAPTE